MFVILFSMVTSPLSHRPLKVHVIAASGRLAGGITGGSGGAAFTLLACIHWGCPLTLIAVRVTRRTWVGGP